MDWLSLVHKDQKRTCPDVRTGDDVRVWYKIREGGKERLAQFEGVVIRVRGAKTERTFTVRRLTHGEGVERVFPVDALSIDRVEILRHGRVHRGRIYFLRHVIKRTRLSTIESRPGRKEDGMSSGLDTTATTQPETNVAEPATVKEESVGSEVTQP
jgi:large subunit ribosomal protein L19